MTFGFAFHSVLCRVRFSWVLAHFLLSWLGSALGKTWVLVQFVLAGFWFLHISNTKAPQYTGWHKTTLVHFVMDQFGRLLPSVVLLAGHQHNGIHHWCNPSYRHFSMHLQTATRCHSSQTVGRSLLGRHGRHILRLQTPSTHCVQGLLTYRRQWLRLWSSLWS